MYNCRFFENLIYKYMGLKRLTVSKLRISGRSSKGNLILLGRGGGVRRRYRLIDFVRFSEGVPCVVIRFEYDPCRTAYIMLVGYYNGVYAYLSVPYLVSLGSFLGS